ncbi:MAG TPA: hypothetical protein VN255_18535 [Mycobacterium sp.]|nr:hypothetical protein [Mycobacterium sp.]
MPFRATEAAARFKFAALGMAGLLCLSAGVAVGCEKTAGGAAIRGPATASTTTSAAPTPSDPAEPVPGVQTTLPDHIPPNAVVCLPSPTGSGRLAMASVPDPVAPKTMFQLPDGWNSTRGTGDVALTSTGPDRMSVRVTIAAIDLDPGGAFLRYAADLRTTSRASRSPSHRRSFAATAASC